MELILIYGLLYSFFIAFNPTRPNPVPIPDEE